MTTKIEIQNLEKIKKMRLFFWIFLILISLILISAVYYKITVKKQQHVCGDFICSQNEENCCVDCGCLQDETCKNNLCIRTETFEMKKCGNGVCELNEGCMSCPSDCRCLPEEYCSESDICKPVFCGNNRCESQENKENCCIDCVCAEGDLCNILTRRCQPIASITKPEAEGAVKDYLIGKNQSGSCNVIASADDILMNESVVVVAYRCSAEPSWMTHMMFVNSNEEIVGESYTI